MPYSGSITLDQLSQSQSGHVVTANRIWAGFTPGMLFGVRSVSGLVVVFYGGNILISGTPTAVTPDQSITLTASAINYVYATALGVVTKVTSAPSGWPGPLAAGATAIADIKTTATGIDPDPTQSHHWRVGMGLTGTTGAQGIQGNPGSDFAGTRKRIWTANGAGLTTATMLGFDTASIQIPNGTATAVSLGSGSLRASIPYLSFVSSASAGNGAQIYYGRTFCYLGNAAGRGGFTVGMRFMMESATSPANQRSFVGMFPGSTIGNVEPDSLVNMFGIGANAGDSNFRIYHNDASGTGTKTALSTPGNYPARGTDNVYELLLQSVPNSSIITGRLTCIDSGNFEDFTMSSDIPSNTTFLTWGAWSNNGSTASAASFGLAQVVAETRY